MRVNLAFKILRQKVRKSSRQYFATKVRKLRFQILKTEHTVPDQQLNISKKMINMEV